MASLSKTSRLWKVEISRISLVMSLLIQHGTSHRTEIGITHLLHHFAEVTHLFNCFIEVTHLFKCFVEVKNLFKCFIEVKHLFKCFIPIYVFKT